MHADVLRLVHRRLRLRCALVRQVVRDLGLAVDHGALAGQPEQVDAMALAAKAHLEVVVRQAFGAQARVGAGLGQQVHRDLLQHAGADAAEHVLGAALLDDDVGNAVLVQQHAQQQPGGAGADDRNLGLHDEPPRRAMR
jgi:hypothetical protein